MFVVERSRAPQAAARSCRGQQIVGVEPLDVVTLLSSNARFRVAAAPSLGLVTTLTPSDSN